MFTINCKVTNCKLRAAQIPRCSTNRWRYPSSPLWWLDHSSSLFELTFQDPQITWRRPATNIVIVWSDYPILHNGPISISIIRDFHVEFALTVVFVTKSTLSSLSFSGMESCRSTTVIIWFNPIWMRAPSVSVSAIQALAEVWILMTAGAGAIGKAKILPRRKCVNVTIYSGDGFRKINVIFYPSIN